MVGGSGGARREVEGEEFAFVEELVGWRGGCLCVIESEKLEICG